MGPVGADALLFRSVDQGRTFKPLPSQDGGAYPSRAMIMRLLPDPAADGALFGVTSDGAVLRIDEHSQSVTAIAEKLPPAYDLVVLQ